MKREFEFYVNIFTYRNFGILNVVLGLLTWNIPLVSLGAILILWSFIPEIKIK